MDMIDWIFINYWLTVSKGPGFDPLCGPISKSQYLALFLNSFFHVFGDSCALISLLKNLDYKAQLPPLSALPLRSAFRVL